MTSVFAQGYTVSDVQCANDAGDPPCTAQAYDHIEVFSFSAPRDQNGHLLEEGQVITGFAGGLKVKAYLLKLEAGQRELAI